MDYRNYDTNEIPIGERHIKWFAIGCAGNGGFDSGVCVCMLTALDRSQRTSITINSIQLFPLYNHIKSLDFRQSHGFIVVDVGGFSPLKNTHTATNFVGDQHKRTQVDLN